MVAEHSALPYFFYQQDMPWVTFACLTSGFQPPSSFMAHVGKTALWRIVISYHDEI